MGIDMDFMVRRVEFNININGGKLVCGGIFMGEIEVFFLD